MSPERDHWEFAWLEPDLQAEPGFPRAAALRAALWLPGEIIKIAFLDDDHELRHQVAAVAGIWVQPFMANLTFRYIADPREADIRISFKKSGSWSCVGNTCRYIKDIQQPTMNFGWLNQDSAQAEIRRVVLHEFGHALGLVHEHSSPAAGIQWDRARVIQDLSYWSPEKVETNVFNAYAAQETNFTAFDPQSIMVYPIPAAWTLDGFSVSMNDDLSPMDRVFIQQTYP
ncbi:MAG: M12 family metallopeptidase [Anaerolineales bacterium]